MIEPLAEKLSIMRNKFTKTYDGSSQIQEIIPQSPTDDLPIEKTHLDSLHLFAKKNPIYYNSSDQTIDNVPCIVYEGDINQYWLSSIQHDSSHSPFSPTWILSAYLLSLEAKHLGCHEVIDIGSGDGRIAYCAKILGLESYAVEIDNELVSLQEDISDSTHINFNSHCSDATSFDYSSLNLYSPTFFIGGLAKMGGDVLASRVIERINAGSNLKDNSCLVFAGSFSAKYSLDNTPQGGWAKLIKENNLNVIKTISLPTVWTFREQDPTPYLFTKFN